MNAAFSSGFWLSLANRCHLLGEHIRDLIGQDIIQVIETHRGKRNKLTQIYQANNQTLQRIKKNYQAKVTLRQELAGNKATSLGNAPIDEAKTESL